MKIYFLTFEFPPAHGGGLSTYMAQALKMHREAGDDVVVITTDHSVREERLDHFEGYPVFRVNPSLHPVSRYIGGVAAASYAVSDALKKVILEFGTPDIVETCDGYGLGYFTLQRKLTLEPPFRDLKVVVLAHTPTSLIDQWDGLSPYELPRFWTRESELFCLKAADGVITPSRFIISELRETFECSQVNFEHIPNPYRVSQKSLLSDQVKVERPYFVLGSRVSVWKGVLDAVRGFDLYWKSGGQSALKLFGSDTSNPICGGSVSQYLRKQYSQQIQDGKLVIGGLVSPEQLALEKVSAIALIHPSRKENFPYTVIEHMAHGGLVLSSRSGGQSELIVHEENGFLFDTGVPEQISQQLHAIEALSPSQRIEMRSAAQSQIALTCNYSKIHQLRLKYFESITTKRQVFPFLRGKELKFDHKSQTEGYRLSVVVPHFNLGNFLKETVSSALNSSYKNLEVVVVDDGSTDVESLRILDEIQELPRVRVLRKKNGGVAEARNFGVNHCNSDFIALLDADDVVDSDYYRQCLAILDHYSNVGFVGCWNNDYNEKGTIRHWATFNPEPPMQYIFNTTNCQGIVIRRQAYVKFGQHDPQLRMFLDDWESTISMLANGVRGVMIPHALFNYRIRGGSIFQSKKGLWAKNYEYIIHKHSEAFKEYASDIISFLNFNGPNIFYHNPTFPSGLLDMSSSDVGQFQDKRIMRLLVAYYRFSQNYRLGRIVHQSLRVFTPLLDGVFFCAKKAKRFIR